MSHSQTPPTPINNTVEFDHFIPEIPTQELHEIQNSADIEKLMDNDSDEDDQLPRPVDDVNEVSTEITNAATPNTQQPLSLSLTTKKSSKSTAPKSKQRGAGKQKNTKFTSPLAKFVDKMKLSKSKQSAAMRLRDQQLTTLDKKKAELRSKLEKLEKETESVNNKYSSNQSVVDFKQHQQSYTEAKAKIVQQRIRDNAEKLQRIFLCNKSHVYDPDDTLGIHINPDTSNPEFVNKSLSSDSFVPLSNLAFLFQDE